MEKDRTKRPASGLKRKPSIALSNDSVFNSKWDHVFESRRRFSAFFVPHSDIMNITSSSKNILVIAE